MNKNYVEERKLGHREMGNDRIIESVSGKSFNRSATEKVDRYSE